MQLKQDLNRAVYTDLLGMRARRQKVKIKFSSKVGKTRSLNTAAQLQRAYICFFAFSYAVGYFTILTITGENAACIQMDQ